METAEVMDVLGRMGLLAPGERPAVTALAGGEGGHLPAFDSNEDALETLVRAIEGAGFEAGRQVAISLDVTASQFHREGRYRLAAEGREMDSDGLAALLLDWLERFPIVSIEDPLAEDDDAGMRRFTATARPVGAPSSRRARAKARTSASCTWPSAGASASSRSARSPARSAWPSGTRPCASRRPWAARPVSLAALYCAGELLY